MKLNNKGFTVVELLSTFTLTMVVTVFLFEVVLELKNVYVDSDIETLVKNENALIASELNKQIYTQNIPSSCSDTSCTLSDGKNIEILTSSVKIGNKTFDMPESASIENANITIGSEAETSKSYEKNFIKISYVVKSPKLKEDIPFNLVLSYR